MEQQSCSYIIPIGNFNKGKMSLRVKLFVCFVFAVLVASEDLSSRPVQLRSFVAEPVKSLNSTSRVQIRDSNLPIADQHEIAAVIQNVYDNSSISGDFSKTREIQLYVMRKYPTLYSSIISRYNNYVLKQRYYLNVDILGNYLIVYGL